MTLLGHIRRIGRTLLALDRSPWVGALGCACALAFALQRLPCTADDLLACALELQSPQGGPGSHVYSALQGRPTETCAAFAAREPEALAGVGAALARIKEETPHEWSRIARLTGVYNRDVRALFLTPPADPSCWKEDANSAYFQAGFPIDSPFIWSIHRLGISTIHVALALMIGSWLGLVCLFLAARRLTGSAVFAILTVALGQYVWDRWAISGGAYFFVFNAFIPLYAGQLLCSRRPLVAASHPAVRWLVEGLVIALVALHSLLQIFVYPFTHRMNAAVILMVVALTGVLLRDGRVLLRAAALAVALYVVMQPYYDDSRRLHAQLTSVNLAAGEGFTTVMEAMGLFERPTYLGLPNGDYAFTWIRAMDGYLLYTAPNLIVHQSLGDSGRALLTETMVRHPLTLIEAVWKRVMIQTVYHRHLNAFWYYKHDASASRRNAAFLTAVTVYGLVCIGSLAVPSTWPLLWPPAALIGWHLFGVNTLLTMVHLHGNYLYSGLFMLLALTPAMAVCARRHRRDPAAAPVRSLAGRRLRIGWRVAAVAALLIAWAVSYGVRESRKEVAAFWLWYPIHFGADGGVIGDDAWRSPSQLTARVRQLQRMGHEAPGAVEMYGAWIFWVYNYQNALYRRGPATHDAALQTQYKAEADSYMLGFYREALAKAPDNPDFGSYALMINDPAWPAIFRRALAAAPTHHHAAYMAYNLIRLGAPRAELLSLIGIYETETARLLDATAANRPGYVGRPAIEGAPAAPEPGGDLVRLSRGQTITLPAIELRGAPTLRVGLYVEVREGAVRVTAIPDGTQPSPASRCTAVDLSSQTIEHYWYVDCGGLAGLDAVRLSVTAVGTDATVLLRDYYPMFSIVRVAS